MPQRYRLAQDYECSEWFVVPVERWVEFMEWLANRTWDDIYLDWAPPLRIGPTFITFTDPLEGH